MKALCIVAGSIAAILGLYFLFSTQESLHMTKNKEENPIVLIKTNLGHIKLELYAKNAPLTVDNFLKYVEDGHYNHTIFHRVIDGFMVQGGGYMQDLKQKETRNSIKNEASNGLSNLRGTIAMARTQDVDSATAQFYINVSDNLFLDHRGKSPQEFGYCVFGKVVDGMDVVDEIKSAETQSKGPYKDLPIKPIEILGVDKVS